MSTKKYKEYYVTVKAGSAVTVKQGWLGGVLNEDWQVAIYSDGSTLHTCSIEAKDGGELISFISAKGQLKFEINAEVDQLSKNVSGVHPEEVGEGKPAKYSRQISYGSEAWGTRWDIKMFVVENPPKEGRPGTDRV